MATFIQQFKAARRVSTPLIAVRTPDPAATISNIVTQANGGPAVVFDIARGLRAANNEGKAVVQDMSGDDSPEMKTNPTDVLIAAQKMEPKSMLFMFTTQRFFSEATIVQAIWNLRDSFKTDLRTLVMLCAQITLPPELAQDVLVLDEPLPDTEQLETIVKETYQAAELDEPDEAAVSKAVDAICGLAAFPAEQACAMSITEDGLDFDALWERKKQQIEQAPGLSVWRGGEKFSDIGGCENIKEFLRFVIDGRNPPRAFVFIDEIEKSLAGAAGDLSGTTQEMLAALLSFMQDRESCGLLFIGPPGAAKSAMAKAAGNEAGCPTIAFDLPGMKGGIIGQSGDNIRAALKLVEAVSQQRAVFIATCNSIGALPPELRRRFNFGTFFFDLPNKKERESIWKIYLAKYDLKDKSRPADEGWTGAEIKQCCMLAWRLRCSLTDAASYIVPVAKSAKQQIERLRSQASGCFISASDRKVYEAPGLNEIPAGASARRAIGKAAR